MISVLYETNTLMMISVLYICFVDQHVRDQHDDDDICVVRDQHVDDDICVVRDQHVDDDICVVLDQHVDDDIDDDVLCTRPTR